MTKQERQIIAEIKESLLNIPPEQIVDTLYRRGLLDHHAIERLAIRKQFKAMVARGVPRCRAMSDIGYQYACSYEKVRNIIYQNRN